MYHKGKLFRVVSYLVFLLLLVYFVLAGWGINGIEPMLYIATLWFFTYGALLTLTKSTGTLYKFYIANNLVAILAGLIMYSGFNSQAGFMVLAVALGMMAFIITFSRKEQV